jgi:hypothetical protein
MFAYAHPLQWVDAYELDPAVIALSEQADPPFHYFQAARARSVSATIIPGDARRRLAAPGREGFYQVIVLDAFNSDAVPMHLFTQQAVELFFQKLAPEGIICIRATNRYVNLQGAMHKFSRRLANPIGFMTLGADAGPEQDIPGYLPSDWILLARNERVIGNWTSEDGLNRRNDPVQLNPPPLVDAWFTPDNPWTDEHNSVMAFMRQDQAWATIHVVSLVIAFLFSLVILCVEVRP